MSMLHRAFLFEHAPFACELAPLLAACLADGIPEPLVAFVNARRAECRDPYEGQPLSANWSDSLENGDLQEIADFALTKYYDPADDRGLGAAWLDLDAQLDETQKAAMLGTPFGAMGSLFDPGRLGSYFQDLEECRRSQTALETCVDQRLQSFVKLLQEAVETGRGVYVTF